MILLLYKKLGVKLTKEETSWFGNSVNLKQQQQKIAF